MGPGLGMEPPRGLAAAQRHEHAGTGSAESGRCRYVRSRHAGSSDLDLIAHVRDAYNALVRVPCTACSYCMPCPQGVNIPGMFQLVNEGSMFGSWDIQRKRYGQMKSEGSSASSCIRCGACEEKCPQHISIRDQLANVAEQLG